MISNKMRQTIRTMKQTCVQPRTRLAFVRSSSQDQQGEATPRPGTIFYQGTAYTEQEYTEALKSGKLNVEPVAVPANSPASMAMPTFTEVMGFSGAAPEIVNGRLAMLGFVAAVAAEINSGEGVLKQWTEEPTGIAMTFILFIAASLVPAFLRKSDSLGPFTPSAELLNGRAAMIGFAALMIIEAVRGSPLF